MIGVSCFFAFMFDSKNLVEQIYSIEDINMIQNYDSIVRDPLIFQRINLITNDSWILSMEQQPAFDFTLQTLIDLQVNYT